MSRSPIVLAALQFNNLKYTSDKTGMNASAISLISAIPLAATIAATAPATAAINKEPQQGDPTGVLFTHVPRGRSGSGGTLKRPAPVDLSRDSFSESVSNSSQGCVSPF
jgi:hypothetical protein